MVEGAAAASIVRVEERDTYYYHLGGSWLGSLPILPMIHYGFNISSQNDDDFFYIFGTIIIHTITSKLPMWRRLLT